MKKLLSFYCLFILSGTGFSQTLTARDIVDRSRSYYDSIPYFSIGVVSKMKSSIAEDTSITTNQCYIDKKAGLELFVNPVSSIGYFAHRNDHYGVYLDEYQFIKFKQKNRSTRAITMHTAITLLLTSIISFNATISLK
jgi:hypothetical protein